MNKEILQHIPSMMVGEKLKQAMEVLPPYEETIRLETSSVRLIALNDIYDIYIPNDMSVEIYSKLYLAMTKSLQKKFTKLAIRQSNENYKMGRGGQGNGIIGGSDSFTIIGESGIGKSSSIQQTLSLLSPRGIVEMKNPYVKIAPCIVVQCPFDCSIKGLLLEILLQLDGLIGSSYYEKMLRVRASTDMLIGSVSQICLNHIGLLVVDEIQNVVTHRNGTQLIGALTQLINNSSISICMVGTPKVESFFEGVNYLARRTLGLRYGNLEYDAYFRKVCEVVYSYQYVKEKSTITNGIMEWLYQHSGGTLANVITLIHDAQEIAILNGKEELGIETLNMAYEQRMRMLHSYMHPCKRKSAPVSKTPPMELARVEARKDSMDLESMIKEAKARNEDVVHFIRRWIPVDEVAI